MMREIAERLPEGDVTGGAGCNDTNWPQDGERVLRDFVRALGSGRCCF